MQPKGALSYIFDGGRWAPWTGSGAGFGGVTLYTPAGAAVDTPTGTGNGVTTANLLGVGAYGYGFNGATWDRVRTNSAATLSATTQPFAQLTAKPGEWSITNAPAVNTIATATRAAGAAGVRHVCTAICVGVVVITGVPVTVMTWQLRDGATGAGTILLQGAISVASSAPQPPTIIVPVNVIGSAATAMTIEFAAAAGAANFEFVNATGYSTI